MVREISLDQLGMTYYIEVEYEEEYGKVGACGVYSVSVEGLDGQIRPLKCDVEQFYDALEGEIQQALEDDIQADKDAYYDMVYEEQRERQIFGE